MTNNDLALIEDVEIRQPETGTRYLRVMSARTRTADDFYVSSLTGMCSHHESEALSMVVLTIRGSGDLAAAERAILDIRATCVEACGTLAEDGA
jgi:hypothetical protein